MTGFARTEGLIGTLAWVWELRSVNGRGLELRFRLPNGWEALEPAFKDAAAKSLKRGNVTANLNIKRDSDTKLALDPVVLDQVLALAMEVHGRIPGSAPPRAEALLALPGVMRQTSADPAEERAAATAPVQAGFTQALAELVVSRQAEGARLAETLRGQLAEIAA